MMDRSARASIRRSASPHLPLQHYNTRRTAVAADTGLAHTSHDNDYFDDHVHDPKPTRKRTKTARATAAAAQSQVGQNNFSAGPSSAESSPPVNQTTRAAAHSNGATTMMTTTQDTTAKVSTAGDKEQRKLARMVRNRNAAQASRDRKKEMTAYLERRVAELEAQLELSGNVPLPTTLSQPTTGPGSVSSSTTRRHQRSLSVTSSINETPVIEQLEEDNSILKDRLFQEQLETARLRARLESLEDKFGRLEHFMSPPAVSSAVSQHSVAEPTFTFDPVPTPASDPLAVLPAATSAPVASMTATPIIPTASLEPVGNELRRDGHVISGAVVPIDDEEEIPASPQTSDFGSIRLLDESSDVTGNHSTWGDWVSGNISVGSASDTADTAPSSVNEDSFSAENVSMEFLDMNFLQDAPAVLC